MTRLYLVEDHTIVREGLRAVFEAAGFTVVGESDNIAQSLSDLAELVPDVLVLDLGLGARSGLDLLAQLQGLGLPTQVLVLTTSDRPRDIAEAVRLGAAGYLLKGTSGRQVVESIHEILQGRRPSIEKESGSSRRCRASAMPTRWHCCRRASGRSCAWWSVASRARPSPPNSTCRPRPSTPTAAA